MSDIDTSSLRETPKPASGRFLLRIEPEQHEALRAAARRAELSLNEYCARKLADPWTELDPSLSRVVRRAANILDGALAGVVAFGSCARGEDNAESDFDVLLAAMPDVPVTRQHYRAWDNLPRIRWRGRVVEPLFATIPADRTPAAGLWTEIATEGIVLFERRFLVSRALARIRAVIAEGRLERRFAAGQPYWVWNDDGAAKGRVRA